MEQGGYYTTNLTYRIKRRHLWRRFSFLTRPVVGGILEDIMAVTTILTNKGTSIIDKAITDGAKCVISRVVTSTHYENLPTDLAAKAPHWWDGAEGTVTGLSLVNTSLDVKVHWEAQQDAQPVKSIGLMVKREGAEKDYLLYAESYSNNAVTLEHAFDKIFSLPINAPAETFDAIGNTMNAEVNNAIGSGGGGSVDTSNLGSSLYHDRDMMLIELRNTNGEVISSIDTSYMDTSLYYAQDTKEIQLRNTRGDVISNIDATAFIKDGMLDSVTVSGGNLNFVFNTDAGKETISIPLTDFFDASAYYTKSEVDTTLTNYYTKSQVDGAFLNQVTYNADTNSLNFASEDGARTVSVSLD